MSLAVNTATTPGIAKAALHEQDVKNEGTNIE
jgi:hypothetical protein